jgi:Domain of unknown function (DUF4430)
VRHRHPLAALAAALLIAATLAGCGLQPTKASSVASITVTRDFGSARLGADTQPKIPARETVMQLLRRFFSVKTSYAGAYVQSIDSATGRNQLVWSYYINGVQASVGADGTDVHTGDSVWWDLHDGSVSETIPAVVGSFPEPFVHGIGGERYPTTLECGGDVQAACDRIGAQLHRDGVPSADEGLGGEGGSDTLNIVVAPWRELVGSLGTDLISAGPRFSGVYAKFVDNGNKLELLNPHGTVVRTLGAGAGLVAATKDHANQPEWFVTGTDVAGVIAAAAAVNPTTLHDRFALAVQGSQRLPVPLQPSQ